MLVVVIIEIILAIRVFVHGNRLKSTIQRLNAVFGEGSPADWEKLARTLNDRADHTERRLDDVEALAKETRRVLRRAVTRVGAVRYSAYEGEGPDLSFSVAMVDEEGTGMTLTGLYGREETRLYLKPLTKGKSRHTLSAEEAEALRQALEERP